MPSIGVVENFLLEVSPLLVEVPDPIGSGAELSMVFFFEKIEGSWKT